MTSSARCCRNQSTSRPSTLSLCERSAIAVSCTRAKLPDDHLRFAPRLLEWQRAVLIHLKPVRLDWSRPARDFIDDKLGEVFWRSALALDLCDPELMQAAFNRWSIKCLARCIVELLDDL